jgi:hypothetical protein
MIHAGAEAIKNIKNATVNKNEWMSENKRIYRFTTWAMIGRSTEVIRK